MAGRHVHAQPDRQRDVVWRHDVQVGADQQMRLHVAIQGALELAIDRQVAVAIDRQDDR